jgi:hypothetical protein
MLTFSRASSNARRGASSLRVSRVRLYSSSPNNIHDARDVGITNAASNPPQQRAKEKPAPKKTQAQLDEELRQKFAGISGDGGEAGVEFEDGQPVSMKRSVKNNMFRYI